MICEQILWFCVIFHPSKSVAIQASGCPSVTKRYTVGTQWGPQTATLPKRYYTSFKWAKKITKIQIEYSQIMNKKMKIWFDLEQYINHSFISLRNQPNAGSMWSPSRPSGHGVHFAIQRWQVRFPLTPIIGRLRAWLSRFERCLFGQRGVAEAMQLKKSTKEMSWWWLNICRND